MKKLAAASLISFVIIGPAFGALHRPPRLKPVGMRESLVKIIIQLGLPDAKSISFKASSRAS